MLIALSSQALCMSMTPRWGSRIVVGRPLAAATWGSVWAGTPTLGSMPNIAHVSGSSYWDGR